MIIDDNNRLVFVHIPKCAGTSVKRALAPFDSTGGRFKNIIDHPDAGRLDLSHLTLRELAAWFPVEYAKVREYTTFAIVREPAARFTSAIFQRLREVDHVPQSAFTASMVREQAEKISVVLKAHAEALPAEYSIFARQSDFVELGGERVVSHLFTTGQMDAVTRFVADHSGAVIGAEKRNRTTVVRMGALRPLQRALRRPYARHVTAERRQAVREWMMRAGFYKDLPKQSFALDPATDAFVRAYYERDFTLLAEVEGAPRAAAVTGEVTV